MSISKASKSATRQSVGIRRAEKSQQTISAGDLPLPTLLSQVLVAFTIDLDNELSGRCHIGRRPRARRPVRATRPGLRRW